MRTIYLHLPITPMAKQSFRYTKDGRRYKDKKVQDYEDDLIVLIHKALPKDFEMFKDVPLSVDYRFSFMYLKSHKDKTNVIHKATTPDIDNLIKPVNDCMQKIIFGNDSRISYITARKNYTNENGIYLLISELE